MCIAIVCFPGCHVINFEINLIFLIKTYFYIATNQDKNLNILRTKRVFKVKRKAFSTTFKGLSVAKRCLRLQTAPLKALIKPFEPLQKSAKIKIYFNLCFKTIF